MLIISPELPEGSLERVKPMIATCNQQVEVYDMRGDIVGTRIASTISSRTEWQCRITLATVRALDL
jgi:hypothetical protein